MVRTSEKRSARARGLRRARAERGEILVARYVASGRADAHLADAVVQHYYSLARYMALRVAKHYRMADSALADDLTGEALCGLAYALQTYEPGRGNRFGTYLYWCMSGRIMHYMRDRFRLVRVPPWLVSPQLAPPKSGWRRQTYMRSAAVLERPLSLELCMTAADGPMAGPANGGLADEGRIAALRDESAEAALARCEELQTAARLLVRLPQPLRDVFVHHAFGGETLRQIGQSLGFSTSYVGHLWRLASAQLKRAYAAEAQK